MRPGRSRISFPLVYLAGGAAWVLGCDYVLGTHAGLSLRLSLLLACGALVTSGTLVCLWWRNERLRMTLQLADAERRASVLAEHFGLAGKFVHDIVLLLEDRTARIIEANDRALIAYGRTRDELIGESFFELWPDKAPAVTERDRFEGICAAGGGRITSSHGRSDGSAFPIEISAQPVAIDGVPFVQVIALDISERVEQERRLAAIASERDRLLERMLMQFERMPAACVVVSQDGRMLQVNPAFQSIFEYRLEDVLGRHVSEVIRDDAFREHTLDLLARLQADPEVVLNGVYENVTAHGQAIVCRWTASALRVQGGAMLGMIAMAENITEQIVAERALRASEERYRALTDVSPVGIFRTDLGGMTVFVNERCSTIMGIARDEALGLGWVKSVHPDDVAWLGIAWRRYIDSAGVAPYGPEFRMVRASDRAIVWVLAQITPEFDGSGELAGHVGTITDITAIKQAQQELQQAHGHLEDRVRERTLELQLARDIAERSDRVKTAFVATMSHELRTPLNSILGFTDVILQGYSGPLTDAQTRQLAIVRESGSQLRALIEDVLDTTRIEAGELGLELTDVDMRRLVAGRLASFETEATRKGLVLRLDAGDALPLLRTDDKRAGQIVTNLLANAIKFTESGGVTVEMVMRAGRLEVTVADTGIGIAQEAIPSLFKSFSQVARPGGRLYEGTGLGLAIARNLARALGGDLTVESVEGHGSRFKLWLPLQATASGIATTTSVAIAHYDEATQKA